MDEILHIYSACVIRPLKDTIEVILYDLMGNREGDSRFFKNMGKVIHYLDLRRIRIQNNSLWMKHEFTREDRMRLDFSIRQKKEIFDEKESESEYDEDTQVNLERLHKIDDS